MIKKLVSEYWMYVVLVLIAACIGVAVRTYKSDIKKMVSTEKLENSPKKKTALVE